MDKIDAALLVLLSGGSVVSDMPWIGKVVGMDPVQCIIREQHYCQSRARLIGYVYKVKI